MVRENKPHQYKYALQKHNPQAIPFDIGSLERHALAYLGDWQKYEKDSRQYGFFYRFGVKNNVVDADGDIATAFLHFVVPYTQRDVPFAPEIISDIDADLEKVVLASTYVFSKFVDNAIGVQAHPPKYMLDELEKIVKG